MAFGAFAFYEAVGQEHLLFGVKKLVDSFADDFAVGFQAAVDLLGKGLVFGGMGGVVVVVADAEACEIGKVFAVGFCDELLGRDALFFGGKHDGRAVGVVGAAVVAFVPARFLKTHPDVGLDVLHHVPKVNSTVGIRQGGSNENFAF